MAKGGLRIGTKVLFNIGRGQSTGTVVEFLEDGRVLIERENGKTFTRQIDAVQKAVEPRAARKTVAVEEE